MNIMVFNEVRECAMKMLIEINRLSKGEIEEESKKKDSNETKKSIDYSTMDILGFIQEMEAEDNFDPNLYVC